MGHYLLIGKVYLLNDASVYSTSHNIFQFSDKSSLHWILFSVQDGNSSPILRCKVYVDISVFPYVQTVIDSEWQMCSPDPIPAKKSGWSQEAIQHHQLGCYLEAAWSSRYLVVHDRRSVENGRGLARCIQLPTQRDTDWTETWPQSEFDYVLLWLHFEASYLELWGWGGGEEGAALNKGREVGEDKEEEEETGRGEELLNPSE